MTEQAQNLSFREILSQKRQTIIIFMVLFLLVATIVTFLTPFRHEATSRILIIQNFPSGIDPYTASKSNEYLSGILAEVVGTNLFFNEVLLAGFNIKNDYFPEDPVDQMRVWRKTVKATAINDTGIIFLSVKHKDPQQADQIIRAVDSVLKTNHNAYHGIGEKVALKIIDQPIVSKNPTDPNMVFNYLTALLAGLVLGLTYAYVFPEEAYSLKLYQGKKRKAKSIKKEMKAMYADAQIARKVSKTVVDDSLPRASESEVEDIDIEVHEHRPQTKRPDSESQAQENTRFMQMADKASYNDRQAQAFEVETKAKPDLKGEMKNIFDQSQY